MTQIAVVITTYNWPEGLEAVLNGYLIQKRLPDELIIADDGSTNATRTLIDNFRQTAPFPVKHVWHEDNGFRASAIRNKAILRAESEYIVFTDGDCIPANWFLKQHERLMERNWFLSGNRLLLSEKFTKKILKLKTAIHTWNRVQWFQARLFHCVNRFCPLMTLPANGWLRKKLAKKIEGAKTCNLSVWKKDLITVNGFDESYTGWGMEDSDLVLRLIRSGIYRKDARFATPVFHLWHPENSRNELEENQRRLKLLSESDRTEAEIGLKQISEE